MSDPIEIIGRTCFNRENIGLIVNEIETKIRLNDSDYPKIVKAIKAFMNEEIDNIDRVPKTNQGISNMVRSINNACASYISNSIAKKYPEKLVTRMKDPYREKLRRDQDVYGNRENHVDQRPYAGGRREYERDQPRRNQPEEQSPVYAGFGISSSFAPAFAEVNITGKDAKFHGMPNNGRFDPNSVDLTLDGSHHEVVSKRMQNQQGGGSFGSNPYASMVGQHDNYSSGNPYKKGNTPNPTYQTQLMMMTSLIATSLISTLCKLVLIIPLGILTEFGIHIAPFCHFPFEFGLQCFALRGWSFSESLSTVALE